MAGTRQRTAPTCGPKLLLKAMRQYAAAMSAGTADMRASQETAWYHCIGLRFKSTQEGRVWGEGLAGSRSASERTDQKCTLAPMKYAVICSRLLATATHQGHGRLDEDRGRDGCQVDQAHAAA